MFLFIVAGTTERFTALILLFVAVLGLLGMIIRAGAHVLRVTDALLAELHQNTAATREISKRLEQMEDN